MDFRFHRQFQMPPGSNLNVSKSGGSVSIGARANFGPGLRIGAALSRRASESWLLWAAIAFVVAALYMLSRP
jgi:hypothetical protein